MKTVVLLCGLAAIASAQQKLTPVDQAGFSKLVASHKGKVVLVNFWATWCKPCRQEMPDLARLEQRLRARGFDVITISKDEPDQEPAAIKALKEFGITNPTYLRKGDDDQFNDAIDAKWGGVLPALILYDRSGKKVRAFYGETPMKDLEAAIQKLL